MHLLKKLLCLSVLLSVCSTGTAQITRKPIEEMPPRLFTLGAFGKDTVLKYECENNESRTEVVCDVLAITYRRVTDKQKAEARAELAKLDTASDADFQKALKAFAAFDPEKLKERAKLASTSQAVYFAHFSAVVERVRAATDRQSLKSALAKMNELEESTCRLSVERLGRPTFSRIGPYRWMSNPGPQGLCDVVNVQLLESTPEHQLLWKLTQTTLSANTELASCKLLKSELNKPDFYSWDYPNTQAPACKYITID